MKNTRIVSSLRLAFAGLLTATLGFAQPLFVDNFDSLTAGPVPGYPYDVFGGGTSLTSATVITTDPVSSPNAIALALNYTGANSEVFGAIFTRYVDYNPIGDRIGVDLTNGTLSVDIKSSVDLAGNSPLIAFRIGNASGATQVRAAEAQYFKPTTGFTTYSVAASSLSLYEAGTEIDLTAIREISIIIYNRGENLAGTFTIDNLTASVTTVPEPSASAAVAGLAFLGFVTLRRRRAA